MQTEEIQRLKTAVESGKAVFWHKTVSGEEKWREIYYVGQTSKNDDTQLACCHEGGIIQIDQDHSLLSDFRILTDIP